MIKSRVLWGLWLLLVTGFWLITENYAGIFLLIVSVVMPLLMAVFTWKAAGKIQAAFQAESFGDKGKSIKAGLILKNQSLFSLDRVICSVKCENLLTGEIYKPTLRVAAPGKTEICQELEFGSQHCGRMRLTLQRAVAYDFFGLFRFPIVCQGEGQTFIRPETFGMEIGIAYGENMSLDSDEFSMVKAGFDPSETFAIREYRPGDRIRQVHWKLSEKFDELMVRDYGLPIQNTILLLLETGYEEGKQPRADCMDALAEGILSLAQELVQQQILFCIGWQNHEEGMFSCMEINDIEELMEAMSGLLGAVPGVDEVSVLGHYLEGREQCESAHVVLFAPQRIENAGMIADQALVTEILCVIDGSGEDQEEGVHVISTIPENMKQDLNYLEI